MPSADLRTAIAGVGFIGTAHARAAVLAGARLVGVAASTPEHAKDAATRLGADRGYVSAEALVVDPDVDVVHVCVPNDQHVALATTALEHGKHVVCEKPLAFDAVGADALARAAARSGRVASVPFVYRYHPMVRELRARIRGEELGSVHLVHGTYLQDWLSDEGDTDWRVDAAIGGPSRAFADIGSHWFDLVEFVLGDRVTALSARFATAYEQRPNEDIALVQFSTRRGSIGSVVVSQTSPGRKNALTVELSGTRASARFDQEHPGSLWLGRRRESTILVADPDVLHPDAARLVVSPPGHPQGYLDCVDRFVADTYAAIGGASPDGLPTFEDGRRAVQLADAARGSAAENGRWIEVAS
jgi:predicted dehydrogenase